MRIGVDVGGTFTDVIAVRDGVGHVAKVLSTPPSYDEGVVEGIAGLGMDDRVARELAQVIHGTTVATNAVLERRGAKTALVTTRGFRDVLELRRLRIPRLYDPFWRKPPPLVERHLRFELDERVTTEGEPLRPVDEDEVRAVARTLAAAEVEAVAVCLVNSYVFPDHEEEVGEILRQELPGLVVSLSTEILREQGEYERTATAAVNAYVQPLMARYLDRLTESLAEGGRRVPLMIMQSSGGLMTAAQAAVRPVFALESGPAAGVIAARGIGETLGLENVIAFDMGGTTAKASLVEGGEISRAREYEVGGSLSAGSRLLRGSGELLRIPSIDIAEVGAGGGSIAWVDPGGALNVGPRSAGADPGPACYGKGGHEPTVTDANVVLGYIPEGPLADGSLEVSRAGAEEVVDELASRLGMSPLEAARGIHQLANARMMRPLRSVSSERGRDPREFALMAYGGSGPIHGVGLAEDLGVQTVVVPALAGVLSGTGLLFARPELHDVRSCNLDARDAAHEVLPEAFAEMEGGLVRAASFGEITFVRSAELRYKGQSWNIEVLVHGDPSDASTMEALTRAFEGEYERLYGVRPEEGSPVVIRAIRVAAVGPDPTHATLGMTDDPGSRIERPETRGAAFGGELRDTPVLSRADVGETRTDGSLLIDEYDTTVVVQPGWSVRRDGRTNALMLERQ